MLWRQKTAVLAEIPTFKYSLTGLMLAGFMTSCSTCGGNDASQHEDLEGIATDGAPGAPVIEVDGGSGLIFTWIDEEGRFEVAHRLEEIPEGHRGVVRVQDPRTPPSDPRAVWVADLTSPEKGRFPVRQMSRVELERLASEKRPSVEPRVEPPLSDGGTTRDPPRVVMYMTSTCPVCRRARSWLSKQGVSFVERNIQQDPSAARELQEKARQQGVSADGVPIFEVGGRLIPGFDQRTLAAAIGG